MTTTLETITEDDWIRKYQPLPNPVSDGYGLDYGQGCTLVETFGKDAAYLETIPEDQIWTVGTDDDGNICCSSGKHFVNRLGYIVTAVPWDNDVFVDMTGE